MKSLLSFLSLGSFLVLFASEPVIAVDAPKKVETVIQTTAPTTPSTNVVQSTAAAAEVKAPEKASK